MLAERIAKTVTWLPHNIHMPMPTIADNKSTTTSQQTQTAIAKEIERANNPAINPFLQHQCNAVLDTKTGKLQEYRDLIKGPDKEV